MPEYSALLCVLSFQMHLVGLHMRIEGGDLPESQGDGSRWSVSSGSLSRLRGAPGGVCSCAGIISRTCEHYLMVKMY
jgi:hypothetical protein